MKATDPRENSRELLSLYVLNRDGVTTAVSCGDPDSAESNTQLLRRIKFIFCGKGCSVHGTRNGFTIRNM